MSATDDARRVVPNVSAEPGQPGARSASARDRGALGGPLQTRKTSVMVADAIRRGILEGRLRPGDRLKESLLAEELAVSRTPIREAIAMLQAEGLLDVQQHRGAQVRSYTLAELEEIYDLRSILEGYAARRAAVRIREDEIELLEASVEAMENLDPTDLEHLVQQNGIFHDTVLEAARSQRLATMVTQTRTLPLTYQSYAWYTSDQLELSHEYHRRVLSALKRGDADQAEYDMRHHLFNARDALTRAHGGSRGRKPS
ncbi:MAG: GntR family transcriptional regulator [Solirubrobacteraceae bacterium]